MRSRRVSVTCLGLLLVPALLAAGRAEAARIIATPLAELTPPAQYRVWGFAIKEEQANGDLRFLYRLDAGLTRHFELGVLVVDPEHARSSTQINLQGLLMKEREGVPSVSIGLWDAANLGDLSGSGTGGSFWVAATKTVPLGAAGGVGPLKLNVGVGTNRLDGLFGGAILSISQQTGLQVEYVPQNLRLPNADSINAAIYHFVVPNVRVRASWTGGNPMLDFFVSGKIP